MTEAAAAAQAAPSPPTAPHSDSLPPGATCELHQGAAAQLICRRCGSYACEACVFTDLRNGETCGTCAAGGLGEPIPWERRKELGHVKAFTANLKAVLTHPVLFYRTPRTESGPLGPGVFGIVAYTLGQLLSLLGVLALLLVVAGVAGIASGDAGAAAIIAGGSILYMVFLIAMVLLQSPVAAAFGIAVGAGLSHLTLHLFKWKTATLEETVRAIAFADAAHVTYAIPLLGPLVGWIWVIVLEVIGVRETHRISTDKAVVAVLGYRALLVFLVIGIYAALFAVMFMIAPH